MTSAPASAAATPFWHLLRTECRRAVRPRHLMAVLGLSAMGVLLATWLPTFPESVYRFFARILDLPTWPEIVVANQVTGLSFFLYWLGVLDSLAILVVPGEERYLDLWLSKPLGRRAYVLARLIPLLAVVAATGMVSAAVQWLVMQLVGLDYPFRAFAGITAVVLAWLVCLIALANLLILTTRDSATALLIAFLPMLVSLFPGMLYLYRPDIFTHVPGLRSVIVFPLTLVWHPEVSARWGTPLAITLLLAAAGLAALAAERVERRDVS